MRNNSNWILANQKRHFYIIAGGAFFLLLGIIHFYLRDIGPSHLNYSTPKADLPIDKINPQDIWMTQQDTTLSQITNENKKFSEKLSDLEKIILENSKREEESEKEKLELKQTISQLSEDLKNVSKSTQENLTKEISYKEQINPRYPQGFETSSYEDPFTSVQNPPFFIPPAFNQSAYVDQTPLRAPIREYAMEEKIKTSLPVNEFIPAAVSVKALLVSSVDAVCGVYANSDPVPVKLRLIDDAHLPKGVKINLKGCLVLASAYGNISNERVYMRLERLTQVSANGEAIESEVTGYVSGEDGKYGVRGVVIDRSVKIVKNAAASGFLGGISQVLQSSVAKRPSDCWNNYSVGTDITTKGAAGGAASAFDMLAEYYIRRAEQVQPVLQVNAGRIVDITFTHGFAMGDIKTKEKIKEIRQKYRGNS